ncbi:MAG: LuxR C-terminal-related transcriptional regulator [Prevotellaceae bacterium]|nr:LuxR C-terminal-related transcriptional regulator [Prevotellaceae bacterium]
MPDIIPAAALEISYSSNAGVILILYNTKIADKMCLGVETINSYRKNLFLKLQARNTAILVKMAFEQKLI